jgi:hypothetical protein
MNYSEIFEATEVASYGTDFLSDRERFLRENDFPQEPTTIIQTRARDHSSAALVKVWQRPNCAEVAIEAQKRLWITKDAAKSLRRMVYCPQIETISGRPIEF